VEVDVADLGRHPLRDLLVDHLLQQVFREMDGLARARRRRFVGLRRLGGLSQLVVCGWVGWLVLGGSSRGCRDGHRQRQIPATSN